LDWNINADKLNSKRENRPVGFGLNVTAHSAAALTKLLNSHADLTRPFSGRIHEYRCLVHMRGNSGGVACRNCDYYSDQETVLASYCHQFVNCDYCREQEGILASYATNLSTRAEYKHFLFPYTITVSLFHSPASKFSAALLHGSWLIIEGQGFRLYWCRCLIHRLVNLAPHFSVVRWLIIEGKHLDRF
jgi:hypothetical protein